MEAISAATEPPLTTNATPAASRESADKRKAREIIAATRTLKLLEQEQRPPTEAERKVLLRFGGFGPVARLLFPNEALLRVEPNHPFRGYKDAGWQVLGEEFKSLLSPEIYASTKGTTFSQFFTRPAVMDFMHRALVRLGVAEGATVLEPGCGIGNFMGAASGNFRFIGVEKDRLTGRIARALHPGADIRIESFRDTKLPALDAVIGNVPFGDVDIRFHGRPLPLHDFFIAKSVEALKPGGVLAVVTSHFTLDKQNASTREWLAGQADFLGAIRLPSDAFAQQGTSVVTDIIFLRRRAPGEPVRHADPDWSVSSPVTIEDAEVPINRYFQKHPKMVLGRFGRKNALYPDDYSVTASGELETQLGEAIGMLPEAVSRPAASASLPADSAFTPPPSEPHIAEGSFFVGPDRKIHQLIDGRGTPVMYRGKILDDHSTQDGRRLAAEIRLVALTRRVLQSQNDGWPPQHRDAARKELNRAYDLFVATYGPINKTTFSETKDGGMIRRMPNLNKFREDPDAMLVMALEEYDELTGKAAKAAIMHKDVVGRAPEVTKVATAEEGLLVCLDRLGQVDLPTIAVLYGKSEATVIGELAELIYHDPRSQRWLTADEYLSGDVRRKLAEAEKAGPAYARNSEALREVQPEDVLPGDIDANLGSPWIPESDIQAFATELFGVSANAIQVAHLIKDAEWSLEADGSATQSVAATSEYGTPSANGTLLLEQALNLKSPTIYDTIQGPHGEERVVNQEATLAARDKQRQIKERFRSWVFAEPERCERLVRLYNDTYNNLRPRLFDGSHLDFPGLNRLITLNPHQKDAVWRGMSAGNTLLAHAVGAGKTFTMAATGMKLKQAGLVKKPLFVVPNHMLEQFSREFLQLYPNAHLLVATKDDLARDRRKLLTAKIASGEWDGIVMTHSSFERVGMSAAYQERFLRQQIEEYETLLHDSGASDATRARRNLIKTIEKQKARREERLKDLLAEDKKDDGLVFDELGVDHLFIDESHYFKNLETPTKMDRVAGIQTGGSERAFDLYMKARYLGEKHPGHGVTFATGTPISNTMVELYTIQRFLDPEGLISGGIEHFDGWAGLFGEVVDAMEISPDGSTMKPRSRFAKFTNLAELMQMVRKFTDVQTADMLPIPRPKLKTGKPIIVACPMSEEQAELQAALVKRYERIRNEKVDPREDNALAITTDGRKLALDARLLTASATDHPGSKLNEMVANVAEIWRESAPIRGTQLIFSDLGVNPTPWGFCVYDEIVSKLVAHGIPREQIATIGDADTDAKKQSLFEKVRQGSIRVLIGSTQKMGTGTNVQKRLIALHHLDAPWKPAEVEQREGRILRQGNENEEVAVFRYVTERSFDAYMWQALENKAKFISQVMTGEANARRAEDIGGQELSYAEVKAIASGNPAVLTLAQADADLRELSVLRKNHDDEQYLARKAKRELPETIAQRARRLAALSSDLDTLTNHLGDRITVGGHAYGRADAIEQLGQRLDRLPERVRDISRVPLGQFRGLAFGIVLYPNGAAEAFLEGQATRHALLARESHGPRAVVNAIERLAGSYGEQVETARRELAVSEKQLRDYEARLGAPFPHAAYLTGLTALRDQLRESLSGNAPSPASEPLPTPAELAERIQALKASHQIEAAPQRTARRQATAEEPLTHRIRRRLAALAALAAPAAVSGEQDGRAESTFPATLAFQPSERPHAAVSGRPSVSLPAVIPMTGAVAAKTAFQAGEAALSEMVDASDAPRHTAGRIIMARKKTGQASGADRHTALSGEVIELERDGAAQAQTPSSATPTAASGDPVQPALDGASQTEGRRPPILTPDPRPVMSIELGDTKGSPRVQLRRSHKYKQMQIRFEQQPDEKYLLMLHEMGWRDRTEEEGIWTKQIDPNARWQSVDRMEGEFKRVANAIRTDKGLEPMMAGGISAA